MYMTCMQVFRESIKAAIAYKENSSDFLDQVMRELEVRFHAQYQRIEFAIMLLCVQHLPRI